MSFNFHRLLPIFPLLSIAGARVYTHKEVAEAAKVIYGTKNAETYYNKKNTKKVSSNDYKIEVCGDKTVICGSIMRLKCKVIPIFKEQKLLNMPFNNEDDYKENETQLKNEFYSLHKEETNYTMPQKLKYKLIKAPKDMNIDESTGQIVWVPSSKHSTENCIFNIIVQDEENLDFVLTKTVEIKIEKSLELFGYDFFKPARRSIKAKENSTKSKTSKKQEHNSKEVKKSKNKVDDTDDINDTNDIEKNNFNKIFDRLGKNEDIEDINQSLPNIYSTKKNVHTNDLTNTDQTNLFYKSEVNERYLLGAGDQLSIKYWSQTLVPKEVEVTIDKKGNINVPVTNKSMSLHGQTLKQAQENIIKELSLGIKNVKVIITIQELKTIQVTIIGDSYRPGTYSVPASSTLYNIFYATGGAKKTGSLRNIKIRRINGEEIKFDFYDFISNKKQSQDISLVPGDVIFIPGYENRVSIKGEIRKPAIYELKNNETVYDIVKLAGGIKATGIDTRIAVQSINPGTGKKLFDTNLRSPESLKPLHDGDIVEITGVRKEVINKVILEGAVDQPSDYEFISGMTIADLIEKGRGLLNKAYHKHADLFRQKNNGTYELISISLEDALNKKQQENIKLQKDDRLVVYSQEDVKWFDNRNVKLVGAVRNPGTYYRADNMRLKDLLLQSKGLLNNASYEQAFIQRFNKDGTVGELLNINIRNTLSGDVAHNPLLNDKDFITIKTVQEVKYIIDQKVEIRGAVQFPGEYYRATNMNLSELIKLAGGLLPNASKIIDVSHKNVLKDIKPSRYSVDELVHKNIPIKDGDFVSVYEDYNIKDVQHIVEIKGAVKQPGFYVLSRDKETLNDIIQRAGGIHSEGYTKGAQLVRETDHLTSKTQQMIMEKLSQNNTLVQSNAYSRFLTLSNLSRGIVNVGSSQSSAKQNEENQSSKNLLGKLHGLNALKNEKNNDDRDRNDKDNDENDKKIKQIAGLSTLATNPTISKDVPPTAVTEARVFEEEHFLPFSALNIRLDLALKNPKSSDNISLKSGDIIVVPKKPTSITIIGAVAMLSKSILYKKSMNLDYYINGTGGYAEDAAADRVVIIRVNGEVLKANRRSQLQAGDIVFVPSKVMVTKLQNSDVLGEFHKVSHTFVNAATLLAILSRVGR